MAIAPNDAIGFDFRNPFGSVFRNFLPSVDPLRQIVPIGARGQGPLAALALHLDRCAPIAATARRTDRRGGMIGESSHPREIETLNMTASPLSLWQTSEDTITSKSLQQVISFAGDGRLTDGGQTSTELRELLRALPLEQLKRFAEECLSASKFPDSGFALQDIVNEIGRRLDFKTQAGRYRGTQGEIGFDGIWNSIDGHKLLVEVKTTDAYRISLDTVANYRDRAIDAGMIDEKSSMLIVVGRQDTGEIEAQIRGSRHAWDVRLVSVESLLKLAAIKERMSDWVTSNRVVQVLRPFDYTRLDDIIAMIFETSQDAECHEDEVAEDAPDPTLKSRLTDLEAARREALERLSKALGQVLVRKGRALRSTSDDSANIVCLASQRYDTRGSGPRYWFAFTPAQRDFLKVAPQGHILLVCVDSSRSFVFDREAFFSLLSDLPTTPPSPQSAADVRHWHIDFTDLGERVLLMPAPGRGRGWDIIDRLLSP